jgi:hypothetical protein
MRRVGCNLALRRFIERVHEFLVDGNHYARTTSREIQIACHRRHGIAEFLGFQTAAVEPGEQFVVRISLQLNGLFRTAEPCRYALLTRMSR